VDARADVFALGAVLFECLTGRRANPGKAHHEIFRVLLDSGVEPIVQVRPNLPAGLCAVVDRCLTLDMGGRYASGGRVMQALEPFLIHDDTGSAAADSGSGGPIGEDPSALGAYATDLTVQGWAGRDALPAESTPSLATGELSGPPRDIENRRWPIWAAAVILLGAGLVWGLGRNESVMVQDAGVAGAVTAPTSPPTSPEVAQVPDAAPEPQPLLEPQPLTRPTGPLPKDVEVLRRVDGDGVFYQAPERLHAFAAIIRDITVGLKAPPAPDAEADEVWRAIPPAVRAWLAEGVDLDGIESHATGLRITRHHLDGLRAVRPRVHKIRRLGRLWAAKNRRPVFAAVNCGQGRPGDRLVTARWTVLGYSGGRCADHSCPRALARALQNAREVGEQLRLNMVLERDGEEGDESSNTRAHCVLR